VKKTNEQEKNERVYLTAKNHVIFQLEEFQKTVTGLNRYNKTEANQLGYFYIIKDLENMISKLQDDFYKVQN